MKEYIISIIICIVASGIINATAPDTANLRKFIGFASSLVITSVIILPISSQTLAEADLLPDVSEEDYEESIDYNRLGAHSLAMAIEDAVLTEHTGITVNKVIVRTEEGAKFIVNQVDVIISATTMDTTIISESLSKRFNCEVNVKAG